MAPNTYEQWETIVARYMAANTTDVQSQSVQDTYKKILEYAEVKFIHSKPIKEKLLEYIVCKKEATEEEEEEHEAEVMYVQEEEADDEEDEEADDDDEEDDEDDEAVGFDPAHKITSAEVKMLLPRNVSSFTKNDVVDGMKLLTPYTAFVKMIAPKSEWPERFKDMRKSYIVSAFYVGSKQTRAILQALCDIISANDSKLRRNMSLHNRMGKYAFIGSPKAEQGKEATKQGEPTVLKGAKKELEEETAKNVRLKQLNAALQAENDSLKSHSGGLGSACKHFVHGLYECMEGNNEALVSPPEVKAIEMQAETSTVTTASKRAREESPSSSSSDTSKKARAAAAVNALMEE